VEVFLFVISPIVHLAERDRRYQSSHKSIDGGF
jgi:hypothetical protein